MEEQHQKCIENPVAHLPWTFFAKRSRRQHFLKHSTSDARLGSKYPSELLSISLGHVKI